MGPGGHVKVEGLPFSVPEWVRAEVPFSVNTRIPLGAVDMAFIGDGVRGLRRKRCAPGALSVALG